MFESKDIQKLNQEREEMKNHILEKYKGTISLLDLMTDLTVELKRIQDRLDKLETKKGNK